MGRVRRPWVRCTAPDGIGLVCTARRPVSAVSSWLCTGQSTILPSVPTTRSWPSVPGHMTAGSRSRASSSSSIWSRAWWCRCSPRSERCSPCAGQRATSRRPVAGHRGGSAGAHRDHDPARLGRRSTHDTVQRFGLPGQPGRRRETELVKIGAGPRFGDRTRLSAAAQSVGRRAVG